MTQRGIAITGAGMIGGAHAAAYRQFAHRFGAAGIALRCVFNYRRIPALAEIRARVAAAELGRPVQISVLFQCDYAADPMLPHSWRYEFDRAGPGTRIERGLADLNGLLEQCEVTDVANRSWNHVAVGAGKDLQWWKEFFSVVRMTGYDVWVSLEMEDFTMSTEAGIRSSIEALQAAISR